MLKSASRSIIGILTSVLASAISLTAQEWKDNPLEPVVCGDFGWYVGPAVIISMNDHDRPPSSATSRPPICPAEQERTTLGYGLGLTASYVAPSHERQWGVLARFTFERRPAESRIEREGMASTASMSIDVLNAEIAVEREIGYVKGVARFSLFAGPALQYVLDGVENIGEAGGLEQCFGNSRAVPDPLRFSIRGGIQGELVLRDYSLTWLLIPWLGVDVDILSIVPADEGLWRSNVLLFGVDVRTLL